MVSLTGQSPQPPNSAPKICSACGGPTRGHSWQGPRTNRKLICPSSEKLNEILLQLWNEGHHEFVRGIVERKGISFPSLPSPPISPEPSTTRTERILRRKSTLTNSGHQPETGVSEKEKHKGGDARASVAGSLRRILSAVIDQQPSPLRSPPRSRSPSPISRPGPDVPITHPDDLPAVGPWNAQRRKEWVTPPAITEMPEGDSASLVPTLLIDSDGHTIREGSRAEAHFRAQAAFEARQRSLQQRQRTSAFQPIYEDEGSVQALSVVHVDHDDDNDYEGSGFLRVLRSVMVSPVIVAIPVRYEDIPRVQETAARQGLHTSILDVVPRNPGVAIRILPQALRNSFIKRTSPVKSVNSEEDNRPIVVIGRDPEMTQRYVEMAQRGVMPGTIALDREILGAPRLITMTQLIFISFFTVVLAWSLFFFFLL